MRRGSIACVFLAVSIAGAAALFATDAAADMGRKRIDVDVVRGTIRAHVHEVRACYEAALARDPLARGRIAVRIEVERDGSVVDASFVSSEIDDPAFERCVTDAVRTWAFPPNGRGRISIVYPFVLQKG